MMKRVEGGHWVVGNDEEGVLGFGGLRFFERKEEAFCHFLFSSFVEG